VDATDTNSFPDFFISYNIADEECAEWIAWQLEEIGHKTVLQAWDFKTGQNFVLKMHEATSQARRTIAILSPEYLAAKFTQSEWSSAFACDPEGTNGKLIPIKVKPVDVTGLLKSIIAIDLTGLSSKEEIKERLLKNIRASEDGVRNKPEKEPPFPETLLEVAETNQHQDKDNQTAKSENNATIKIKKFEDSPEFKAGLVDKDEQARHVFKWLDDKFFIDEQEIQSPLSFLLFGAASQWPDALVYILYNEIKDELRLNTYLSPEQASPESIRLTTQSYKNGISPENHLWELIAKKLNCPPTLTAIGDVLRTKKVPHILFRRLMSDESRNPELVRGMLEAWDKLKSRHILILFYEYSDEPKPIWQRWFNKNNSLIDKLNKSLAKEKREKYLMPVIAPVNKRHINEWIDSHFNHGKAQDVKDFVNKEIKTEFERRKQDKSESKERLHRIRITPDNFEIHHHDLKNILIDALKKFG
jgi:hypothetical protein